MRFRVFFAGTVSSLPYDERDLTHQTPLGFQYVAETAIALRVSNLACTTAALHLGRDRREGTAFAAPRDLFANRCRRIAKAVADRNRVILRLLRVNRNREVALQECHALTEVDDVA